MKRHKCFNKKIQDDFLSQREDHNCTDIEKDMIFYKRDFFDLSKNLRK